VYLIIYPGLLIVSFSIELFYLFFLQKYLHIGSSIVIAVVELAERFSVCDWQHLLSFLELNLLFLNFFFTCVVLWLHCRFRAFFFFLIYSFLIIQRYLLFQTNFIQQKLPEGSHTGAGGLHGQAGALGLGQRASTGLNTFYQFWYVPLYDCYDELQKKGKRKTDPFAYFQVLCDTSSRRLHR